MSMAIAHFSVGATLTIWILIVSGLYRSWVSPAVIVAGGGWGMLPDVWWVTSIPKSFHEHPPAPNLFFAHHYMDGVDPIDSRPLGGLLFGVFCVSVVVFVLLNRCPIWKPEKLWGVDKFQPD